MDRQRQIAADQVRYARGAFWPNVALTAAYARADQEPAAATLNRESLYGGVSLNFPFFEGGLRTAELQEARRRETQAELSYQDLRKTIAIEVQGVYLDLATQRGVVAFRRPARVRATITRPSAASSASVWRTASM